MDDVRLFITSQYCQMDVFVELNFLRNVTLMRGQNAIDADSVMKFIVG